MPKPRVALIGWTIVPLCRNAPEGMWRSYLSWPACYAIAVNAASQGHALMIRRYWADGICEVCYMHDDGQELHRTLWGPWTKQPVQSP